MAHPGITIPVATSNPLASVLASVPPVLDSVIAPPVQVPSDLRPALAHLCNQSLNTGSFLRRDRFVVEGGLKILVITFPTLLRCSGVEQTRDPYPVMGSMNLNKVEELGILLV